MPNIWPWSRIAELETQIRIMDVQSRARMDQAERDMDVLHKKLAQARKIETVLRVTLAHAHLRDPKTGRILPKGKTL
jgi:hypothetical protein